MRQKLAVIGLAIRLLQSPNLNGMALVEIIEYTQQCFA